MSWLMLPELGTTPLRFESEDAVRKHLRVHYPDRRPSHKDDLGELYRLPSGGFVHCWRDDEEL